MIDFILRKFYKKKFEDYAGFIRVIAMKISDERAAKCGYDLMMGLANGNADKRLKAWQRYLEEYRRDDRCPFTEEHRDGIWVPAIEVDL